jgi:nucleoside phosphorylase
MNNCHGPSVQTTGVRRPADGGTRRTRALVDALIVTTLPVEYHAFAGSGMDGADGHPGVIAWQRRDPHGPMPYEIGCYLLADGSTMRVALARATRPGCIAAAATASCLAERLGPRCLAMSGVCAGNPAVVRLGDVVIADSAYVYDEGHQTVDGFAGNYRQHPMPNDWVRAAQDLRVPFPLAVGPMVSGNTVVRDGRIWQRLADRGGRHVAALDMEAAAVAMSAYHLGVPAWAVVKGVTDHADPAKDDRHVAAASRAAADVLWTLLLRQLVRRVDAQRQLM